MEKFVRKFWTFNQFNIIETELLSPWKGKQYNISYSNITFSKVVEIRYNIDLGNKYSENNAKKVTITSKRRRTRSSKVTHFNTTLSKTNVWKIIQHVWKVLYCIDHMETNIMKYNAKKIIIPETRRMCELISNTTFSDTTLSKKNSEK